MVVAVEAAMATTVSGTIGRLPRSHMSQQNPGTPWASHSLPPLPPFGGHTSQPNHLETMGCHVLQVQYISPNVFYGVSDNSNGKDGLTYFLYPPPALNSVGANDSGSETYLMLLVSPHLVSKRVHKNIAVYRQCNEQSAASIRHPADSTCSSLHDGSVQTSKDVVILRSCNIGTLLSVCLRHGRHLR